MFSASLEAIRSWQGSRQCETRDIPLRRGVQHSQPVEAVYGAPPPGLVTASSEALQVSPLSPGASSLEQLPENILSSIIVSAPPGTIERRYQLALALRGLSRGARLTALAPKDKGGARLRKELESFGCPVEETHKQHHRICLCARPDTIVGLAEALSEGAPRLMAGLGLWSQPGVFSWDRLDPGSALLIRMLPTLSGAGADLGCGIGHLALAALRSPEVDSLTLIDVDRRAVEAAGRNVTDRRAHLVWGDATAAGRGASKPGAGGSSSGELDFVVTNPPFHDGGAEDRELGRAFVRSAAGLLRKGGALWLVANRHLPYEAVLASLFSRVDVRAEQAGYKVFEARR